MPDIEYLIFSRDHVLKIDEEQVIQRFNHVDQVAILNLTHLIPETEISVAQDYWAWENRVRKEVGTFQRIDKHPQLWNDLNYLELTYPIESYHYFQDRINTLDERKPYQLTLKEQEQLYFYKWASDYVSKISQESPHKHLQYLAVMENLFSREARQAGDETMRLMSVAVLGYIRTQRAEWENQIRPGNYPDQIGDANRRSASFVEKDRWVTRKRTKRS